MARVAMVVLPFGVRPTARAPLVRYEKKAANYLAAVQLACALLWFRRLHRLTT